jgi:hypothetical protein
MYMGQLLLIILTLGPCKTQSGLSPIQNVTKNMLLNITENNIITSPIIHVKDTTILYNEIGAACHTIPCYIKPSKFEYITQIF